MDDPPFDERAGEGQILGCCDLEVQRMAPHQAHLDAGGDPRGSAIGRVGDRFIGALEVGTHGAHLIELGYDADIRVAADVDRFCLVAELRRDPLRIERAAAGIVQSHWPR